MQRPLGIGYNNGNWLEADQHISVRDLSDAENIISSSSMLVNRPAGLSQATFLNHLKSLSKKYPYLTFTHMLS